MNELPDLKPTSNYYQRDKKKKTLKIIISMTPAALPLFYVYFCLSITELIPMDNQYDMSKKY